ncbi:MAG: NAD(P)/FAD-dependent oxidoreductase [Clostridiales bacterium]|nr:NAD(P)/FAD-dependent oxidoreductase [Clostridiales bacterium]
MAFFLTKPLNIPLGHSVNDVRQKLLKLLCLKDRELESFRLHRQSVDARNKSDVHFVCSYVVETNANPANATAYEVPQDVLLNVTKTGEKLNCIVVGAGPAGLFAALYLAKSGCAVTVVERGSDVEKRQAKVNEFFNGGELDEHTNVQFGLGGAGTFSDGKLTTGISSPLTYTVFQQLVRSGAPQDILTSALPHVGTDKLVNVVANLRDEIVSCGGKFLFDTSVTDFIVENNAVKGVVLDCGENLLADCVLLACGNGARDIYTCLNRYDALTFKPFAVGLRIEHTREFINTAQYGRVFATHRDLPTASYKLVGNFDTHSCYSFCMCPGGVVVAASSERDSVVVNGMSNYLRDGDNSNSALVVNVTADDVNRYGYGSDALAGMRFQQDMERRAYAKAGGNYLAPCQNVTDFIAGTLSTQFDVAPSYPRGVTSVNLRELLPKDIGDTLAQALTYFDRKIVGFGSSGVLTGVETRTSSPVRITRNEAYQSKLARLYPVGEGAGYAGGIVSSAVDGLRVAKAVLLSLNS